MSELPISEARTPELRTSEARLAPRRRRYLLAVPRLLVRLLLAAVIILDELVRPLYRPLIDRLSALAPMRAFERWVAARAPFTVLVLLAVPYAFVEPLKFVALVWIADGSARIGTVVFVLAHLVSFVLIERIYSAGRAQLMTIPFMAWLIGTAIAVRSAIAAWLELDRRMAAVRRLLRRLRAALR